METLEQENTSEVVDNTTPETETIENAGSGLDVVNETYTLAVYKNASETETDPKKIKYGFGEYKEGNALYKASNPDEKGATEHIKYEILLKVDVTVPVVHAFAGISQVVPDEEEAVAIFNKGLQQKMDTKLRSYFGEADENGLVHANEVSFDASEFAAEPMKRRSMTETQKLFKILKGASSNDLKEVLQAMGIL
jgi:hypothetical protein